MIICRAHRQDLSAFPRGTRIDHNHLGCGRDLNRRPSARNTRASVLDHSATRPVNYTQRHDDTTLQSHDERLNFAFDVLFTFRTLIRRCGALVAAHKMAARQHQCLHWLRAAHRAHSRLVQSCVL